MIFFCFILAVILIARIGFIQFVQGSELQSMAYMQQTLNRQINPKRGTIYDSSGTAVLAVSASSETVSVNPNNISKENKDKTAKAFSDIFRLDYNTVLQKVSKNTSIEIIAKKVDKADADKLRIWMNQNNIGIGINIDEDTKRYYPYSKMASSVIGFTGSDNQGLQGLELEYDNILKGQQGKILKMADATGTNLGQEGEDYIAAKNGNDIICTIDATVQGIAEKYLTKACTDNKCTGGGDVIIMDSHTGDILAMAEYPNYDLNSPYIINNDELKSVWDSMQASERSNSLSEMWRNRAVSNAYEPGSTFKLLTTSAALQEGITEPDRLGEFYCTGGITVAGVKIKCWRSYNPHGSESLRQALMNSCNPVFVGLGEKMGVHTFYNYLNKFGMLSKTGIDLPGEGQSIFLKENKVGPVELATYAFGQRFKVTPIQMIKLLGTIANKGVPVTPRLVKATVDSSTGIRTYMPVSQDGRVVSEDTAENVLSMMGSVASEGTGKNAAVAGYSIGGKTGTSEDGVNTGKYITSFLGVSDSKNPDIVMAVILYNPTGEAGHQGGMVAAPVAGEIFKEVLPYLNLQKTVPEAETQSAAMPKVTGMTASEAEKILTEAGLEYEIQGNNDGNAVITDQLPAEGIMINTGTRVILKTQ